MTSAQYIVITIAPGSVEFRFDCAFEIARHRRRAFSFTLSGSPEVSRDLREGLGYDWKTTPRAGAYLLAFVIKD